VYNETGTYGTDLFTREADKVLNDHDGSKPLFLYFAQQAVHVGNNNNPLQAPKKYLDRLGYIGDEKRRTFAGIEKHLKFVSFTRAIRGNIDGTFSDFVHVLTHFCFRHVQVIFHFGWVSMILSFKERCS